MRARIHYQEKIVVFLDMLGFKNLVNDESKCEKTGALLKMPYLLGKNDNPKLLKIKGLSMTSISDSLVFSVRPKEKGAMNKIVELTTVFTQTLLSHYSILVRGGIAIGKLYHDNEIVYGPGLVKAYELENKIAVYPRIIMMASDFEQSILSCGKTSQTILQRMFVRDDDGFLTLDCFYYANQSILELCHSNLRRLTTSNLRVQQKINWMIATLDKKKQEKTS